MITPICCLFVAYFTLFQGWVEQIPASFCCARVPRAPAQTALHAKRELWTGYLQKAACPRTWASGQSLTATTMYKLLETGCWGSYIFKAWGSSMTFCVWLTFKKARRLEEKQLKLQSLHPNMFHQTCLPCHPCAHRKAACTQTPHGGSVRPPVLRCSTASKHGRFTGATWVWLT